jgi:hypothetical protein
MEAKTRIEFEIERSENFSSSATAEIIDEHPAVIHLAN